MNFETNYQEIRRDAAGLMWVLSKELKQLDRQTIMVNPDIIVQYSNILNYLGAVVCDDWQNIKEIASELEVISIPKNSSSHSQGLFKEIVKEVERHSGIVIKPNLSDETQALNLEEYTLIGWKMGFIESFNMLFRRNRKIIVE